MVVCKCSYYDEMNDCIVITNLVQLSLKINEIGL